MVQGLVLFKRDCLQLCGEDASQSQKLTLLSLQYHEEVPPKPGYSVETSSLFLHGLRSSISPPLSKPHPLRESHKEKAPKSQDFAHDSCESSSTKVSAALLKCSAFDRTWAQTQLVVDKSPLAHRLYKLPVLV